MFLLPNPKKSKYHRCVSSCVQGLFGEYGREESLLSEFLVYPVPNFNLVQCLAFATSAPAVP